ncbi:LAMI_0D09714g1_1 [Lachancea mirantina]|uniref:LAMI_0D09714g1_1 n=1 Tax=Lachancea mirantina TaxID=1230905 RepID=A0A1G4JDQ2_9SACH|nr:LAMI_0D09714g1_1 [Lachancea mirantina]
MGTSPVCPICLEEMNSGIGQLTHCGHEYHIDCLRKWHNASGSLNCPICRVESYILKDMDHNLTINLKKSFNLHLLITSVLSDLHFLDVSSLASSSDPGYGYTECDICGRGTRNGFQRFIRRQTGTEVSRETADGSRRLYCRACWDRVDDNGSPWGRRNREYQVQHSDQDFAAVDAGISRNGRVLENSANSRVRNAAVVKEPSEIEETWKLLDRLQHEQSRAKILEEKQKIQMHVRKTLDRYYKDSRFDITRSQYTDINKSVSRQLYELSLYAYKPGFVDYDLRAETLISEALRKERIT